MLYIVQWNPSCEATPFASEKWPLKRVGLSSGVEIKTFMFRFALKSGLSRGCGLSSGWPLKRGSTEYSYDSQQVYVETLISCYSVGLQAWPEDALERVAHKFLENVDIEDDQKQDTVHICKYFHTSGRKLSEK